MTIRAGVADVAGDAAARANKSPLACRGSVRWLPQQSAPAPVDAGRGRGTEGGTFGATGTLPNAVSRAACRSRLWRPLSVRPTRGSDMRINNMQTTS